MGRQRQYQTHFRLTPKEQEYIQLLARGMSMRAIADLKYVSEQNIKNTIRRARQRIGAANNVHLMHLVTSAGLIELARINTGGRSGDLE